MQDLKISRQLVRGVVRSSLSHGEDPSRFEETYPELVRHAKELFKDRTREMKVYLAGMMFFAGCLEMSGLECVYDESHTVDACTCTDPQMAEDEKKQLLKLLQEAMAYKWNAVKV